MSKKSRKKLKQWKKRAKIAKRESVQTKRTAKNAKKWEVPVNYENNRLARAEKFKIDNLNKQRKYG